MKDWKDYIVRLSNGEDFCFYPGPFKDIRSLTRTIKVFKVRTIRDCINEDWKTAIAHHQPRIPKGTELEVKDILQNLYGKFIEVDYQEFRYSLDPRNVEYIGSYEIKE